MGHVSELLSLMYGAAVSINYDGKLFTLILVAPLTDFSNEEVILGFLRQPAPSCRCSRVPVSKQKTRWLQVAVAVLGRGVSLLR